MQLSQYGRWRVEKKRGIFFFTGIEKALLECCCPIGSVRVYMFSLGIIIFSSILSSGTFLTFSLSLTLLIYFFFSCLVYMYIYTHAFLLCSSAPSSFFPGQILILIFSFFRLSSRCKKIQVTWVYIRWMRCARVQGGVALFECP